MPKTVNVFRFYLTEKIIFIRLKEPLPSACFLMNLYPRLAQSDIRNFLEEKPFKKPKKN